MFKHKKYIWIFSSILVTSIFAQEWEHNAASVLPRIRTKNGVYYVLAREGYGPDKNTYEDFGGKRDKGEDYLTTAAREFYEEAIIPGIFNVSLEDTITYVKKYAKQIKVGPPVKYVTYVAPFQESFITGIRQRFFNARSQAKEHKFREKDKIALVKEEDLYAAMRATSDPKKRTVIAQVFTKDNEEGKTEAIPLRYVFILKLQEYFKNPTIGTEIRRAGSFGENYSSSFLSYIPQHKAAIIVPTIVLGVGSIFAYNAIQQSKKQLKHACEALQRSDQNRALELIQHNRMLPVRTKNKINLLIRSNDVSNLVPYVNRLNRSYISCLMN